MPLKFIFINPSAVQQPLCQAGSTLYIIPIPHLQGDFLFENTNFVKSELSSSLFDLCLIRFSALEDRTRTDVRQLCDSSHLSAETCLIAILCHVKMDSPRNITKSYLTAALITMMDNTGA